MSSRLGGARVALAALGAMMLAACGGGGGGGDGGGPAGRTTDTALRLIHASIDAVPLTVTVNQGGTLVPVHTARYAQATDYFRLEEGDALLTVERANSPGSTVVQFPLQLAKETEYTLFAVGEARKGNFRVTLLQDIVARPEEGLAHLQVMNGYDHAGPLSVSVGGLNKGPLTLGATTGFFEVASGPQTLIISTSQGGELARVALDLPDRGEATIVVSGAGDLGVHYITIYNDLD